MPSPLVVTGRDPVQLHGSIDGANKLQFMCEQESLDDYSQSLDAEHEDLSSSSEVIRIELADFSSGGATWQISASHQAAGNTITWPRGSGHAYHDFAAMTDALEIDVVATSNASPSATKTRTIWIKTKPVDGQPDRP